jgi:hypothetical protein
MKDNDGFDDPTSCACLAFLQDAPLGKLQTSHSIYGNGLPASVVSARAYRDALGTFVAMPFALSTFN